MEVRNCLSSRRTPRRTAVFECGCRGSCKALLNSLPTGGIRGEHTFQFGTQFRVIATGIVQKHFAALRSQINGFFEQALQTVPTFRRHLSE